MEEEPGLSFVFVGLAWIVLCEAFDMKKALRHNSPWYRMKTHSRR